MSAPASQVRTEPRARVRACPSPSEPVDVATVDRTIPRGADAADLSTAPGVDAAVWLLHVRYARTQAHVDLDALVREYEAYALSLAHRMRREHEPLEDLEQVAREALVVALRRFDPERGLPFPAYATPTILGALRRHYRDHGWAIRVPRRVHELTVLARRTSDAMTNRSGRVPSVAEVAAELRIDLDDLLRAQEAAYARNTASLEALTVHVPPAHDRELARVENHVALGQALAELGGRDRQLVELYYFQQLPQHEIAARFGVSQMQISRWTTSIVRRLRNRLEVA